MAAIVRVKRLREEEPADALCMLSKKIKIEGAEGEEVKSVFKFAGTVTAKGNDIATQFVHQAIRKEKLEREYKRHEIRWDEKRAEQRKKITTTGRCKVVSQKRAQNFLDLQAEVATDVSAESKRRFLLYDVEKEDNVAKQRPAAPEMVSCNDTQMTRIKKTLVCENDVPPSNQFVYDLYYMNVSDFDYRMLESVLAVELMREEYIFLPQDQPPEEIEEDEDDENVETNWRNDYPDEDPKYYETIDDEYYYGDDGCMTGLDADFDARLTMSETQKRFNDNVDHDGDDNEPEADPASKFAVTTDFDKLNAFYKQSLDQK